MATTSVQPSVDQPFTKDEYEERLVRVRVGMEHLGLDVLLLSAPENIYYLTGFQTQGVTAHPYLAIFPARPPVFLTRFIDLSCLVAILPGSPIADYVGYDDVSKPVPALVELLKRHGFRRGRIGVETKSTYLTVDQYLLLKAAFGDSDLVEASSIVEALRIIKSAREIDYHREAGRIAVEAMRAGLTKVRPGNLDNDVAAAVLSASASAGGEWVAMWPNIKAGRRTGRAHTTWQNTRINKSEPFVIELPAAVWRYHSPVYRTVVIEPTAEQRRLGQTVKDANLAGTAAMAPGVTVGAVYETMRAIIAERGHADLIQSRLGYTVGIAWPPTWVQQQGVDVVSGSETILKPGMVFHFLTLLLRSNEFGMGNSSSIAITETGHEILTPGIEAGPFLLD